jgi:stage II sporulation protein E
MGSGGAAERESGAVAELFELLIQTGIGTEAAAGMLGSLMPLNRRNDVCDACVTLDVFEMDLDTGRAEFTKLGAVSTYVARFNGKVEVLRSHSLPFGILYGKDSQAAQTAKRELADGDWVVMTTDGVVDYAYDDEHWLASLISERVDNSPQELADAVITRVAGKDGGAKSLRDDVTVLAAKVYRCM